MNRRTLLAALLGVPALAQDPVLNLAQYRNGHCPVCGEKYEGGFCLSDFDDASLGISRPAGCPPLEGRERALVTCAKCRNVFEMSKGAG